MGLYFYCVANVSKDDILFGKGGVENSEGEIFSIAYKDIGAIVSEAEIKQYKPTRRNNLTHERIIERVMEKFDAVPCRFGVVANNKDEIKNLLEEKYDEFKKQLTKLENKIEIGLNVSYVDFNGMLKKIGEDNKTLNKMKKDKVDLSKDRNRLIEVGKYIEKELNSISENYKKSIFEELSDFAYESVINENYIQEMILNASFLIDKDKEGNFMDLLKNIDKKYIDLFNFKCIGPFPAYNFIKV